MIEKAMMEMGRFDETQRALLDITWRMIEAIHTGDTHTYAELCRPELTCFEDVCAYRIDGVAFHVSLIRQMASHPTTRPLRFDLLTPHVQVYGNTGIVTYTRLMTFDIGGKPNWHTFNETRVFIRDGQNNSPHGLNGLDGNQNWKMAHFHRSPT